MLAIPWEEFKLGYKDVFGKESYLNFKDLQQFVIITHNYKIYVIVGKFSMEGS